MIILPKNSLTDSYTVTVMEKHIFTCIIFSQFVVIFTKKLARDRVNHEYCRAEIAFFQDQQVYLHIHKYNSPHFEIQISVL
jgi:esterase/lipase superfamily enzyme